MLQRSQVTRGQRPMAKLRLRLPARSTTACSRSTPARCKPEGIDLNFIRIEQPRPIFDRMSGGQEFDVAEYSSSEFVQRFANKQCPFVAIPVFPSRGFRHGFIGINKKSGISKPKDLEGKRVGVPLYTMTAAIFIRGLLQHEYGVDFSKIHWVQGAINARRRPWHADRAAAAQAGEDRAATANKSLDDLIEDGVVDATIGTRCRSRSAPIRISGGCSPTSSSSSATTTSAPASIRSCISSRSRSDLREAIRSSRAASTTPSSAPRRSR